MIIFINKHRLKEKRQIQTVELISGLLGQLRAFRLCRVPGPTMKTRTLSNSERDAHKFEEAFLL